LLRETGSHAIHSDNLTVIVDPEGLGMGGIRHIEQGEHTSRIEKASHVQQFAPDTAIVRPHHLPLIIDLPKVGVVGTGRSD
jgi:hypothetical protein